MDDKLLVKQRKLHPSKICMHTVYIIYILLEFVKQYHNITKGSLCISGWLKQTTVL